MENFNQEIQTILHKQQVLERFKSNYQNENISNDAYAIQIATQCRHKPPLIVRITRVLAYAFAAFLLLFILIYTVIMLLGVLLPKIPIEDSSAILFIQPPLYQSESPIESSGCSTSFTMLFPEHPETPR